MVQKVLHGGAVGTKRVRGYGGVADQVHRADAKIAPPWCKKCCTAVQSARKVCAVAGRGGSSAPCLCKKCTAMVQKVLHGGAVGTQTVRVGGAAVIFGGEGGAVRTPKASPFVQPSERM